MRSCGGMTVRLVTAGLALATAGILVPPSSAQSPALDLPATVAGALERNPQVVAAQANVLAAEAQLRVARASLQPTISASAGGSVTGGTGTGNGSNAQAGVGVTYLIYNGGVREAQIRQAEAKVEGARASFAVVRAAVALAAVQAFLAVVTAEQTVAVRTGAVASAQSQLDAARARFSAGVVAQADVLRADSQLATAEVDLVSARAQLESDRVGLRTAIGLDAAAPVEIVRPAAPPAYAIGQDEALRRAAERPEVRKGQSDVRATEAALAQAMSASGITVTANGQYALIQTGSSAGGWSAGVSISIPLSDGGAKQAGVEAARANLDAAKAEAERVNQQIRQEAVAARLALEAAIARTDAAQRALAAAQEALRVAQGRYQAGVGTLLEVTSTQADAVAAELTVVQAAANRWTALATLRRAVGLSVLP